MLSEQLRLALSLGELDTVLSLITAGGNNDALRVAAVADRELTGLLLLTACTAAEERPSLSLALLELLPPADPIVCCTRGSALYTLQRHCEAEAAYRAALQLAPDYFDAAYGLAAVLLTVGCCHEAVSQYRSALALSPDEPLSLYGLGSSLLLCGKVDAAVPVLESAVAALDGFVEAHYNLGCAYLKVGRPGDAAGQLQRVIGLAPHHIDAYTALSQALMANGALADAGRVLDEVLARAPGDAAAWLAMARLCRLEGRLGAALQAVEKSLETCVTVPALSEKGILLLAVSRPTAAEQCLRQAISVCPDAAQAWCNLGVSLWVQGLPVEALECLDRSLALAPGEGTAASNRLMISQYSPLETEPSIAARHHRWGAAAVTCGQARSRSGGEVVRIGYLSPDLCIHPVGFFLDGVLAHHDKRRFRVHCYHDRANGDALTAKLRSCADAWRDCHGISDDALTDLIAQDGIDILVDLAGHTAGNRQAVFSRRPAPLQVTWAGYVGTTGNLAIDLLVSDTAETPAGSDALCCERLALLPECYVCYAPPEYAPDPGALPMDRNGYVTFCCFNNTAKLNTEVLTLWAQLLADLPASRLLLVSSALGDARLRERLETELLYLGADRSQLDLRSALPHRELLACYGEADIALDPFPYAGGLTTLESLWMGVPVVALPGDRFAGRHSASHLRTVGLERLVARDREGYVQVAKSLAADPVLLRALRGSLRGAMAASALLDHASFTRHLESALLAEISGCSGVSGDPCVEAG